MGEDDKMHSKPTVRYICEVYESGNKYYYKQEFLMENESWGTKRPISEQTYIKRKSDGFKCEVQRIKKSPASIIQFPVEIMTLNQEAQ